MIIILLAWISIFFIFFSFGDCFISLFNKITKRNERYNVTDTFILGMCFTLIPLSITSLWLPSNHYMMFTYIGLGVMYWIVRRERLIDRVIYYKIKVKNLSLVQHVFLLLPFFIFILCALWQSYSSDAAGYHYQLTHWNESYGIVPGIANLEDRMGFNSNYSLLSAIFTFRFITGDQHFLIQSLLASLISCQIMYEAIRSRFDIRYIIFLFLFFFYCWGNYYYLNNSSTDILPALCLLYLLSKYLISPSLFKRQYLFVFFIPVALVTFKLSVIPIALLSVYCLYSLVKNKKWNTVVMFIALGLLIVVPWLARNVIISGYLIYPLYKIDLFSFDWKMPEYVAVMQSDWISDYPRIALSNTTEFMREFIVNRGIASEKSRFINSLLPIIICALISFSPLIMGFNLLKKKKTSTTLYLLYIVMIIYIFYCILSAPDFRFIAGVAYAVLLLEICVFFNLNNRTKRMTVRKGYLSIVLFLSFLTLIAVKELYNGYMFVRSDDCGKQRPFCSVLYAPYTSQARAKLKFQPYQMGSVTVYISTLMPWFPYDKIPGTGAPSQFKYQPIEDVEARGKNISDGFRPKKDI